MRILTNNTDQKNRCTSSVFMLGKDVNQMALLLRMCYDNAMLTEDNVGYMEISYKFSMYAFKPAIAISVVCEQLFCLLQITQFVFSCFSNNETLFQVPKKVLNTKIIRQPQKPLRLEQREYNLFKPNSKDEIENHLKTISQINKLLVEDDKQTADIKSLKSPSAVKRFTFGETLIPSNSIWSVQAPKKSTTMKSETLKVKNYKEILKVKNDKENVKVTKVKNSKVSSGSKMSSDQIKANFKKKVLALKNQNKKVKS